MSQIAFIVDAPDYPVGALASADFLSIGNDLVRQVRQQQVVSHNTTLASVAVSGPDIIISPDVQTSVIDGDVAGDLPLSGITTAAVLYSVTGIKIADQTTTDFTSEFGAKLDAINNTGGTDTTDYTLVVVWR